MKVCVSGKGGTGKTVIAGTLTRQLARRGLKVLAIDADANYNLHSSLGIPDEQVSDLLPLSDMKELIRERTGAEPYSIGAVFKANPKVSDLPQKLAIEGPDGVRFVLLGTIRSAGSGCTCPANAFLKAFLRRVLADEHHVVVDMEAGIEHLGRGTARYADLLLIIVEPTVPGIMTAKRIGALADQLGLRQAIVANKVRNGAEQRFVVDSLSGFEILQIVPHDECVIDAQMKGKALIDAHPESKAVSAIEGLAEKLVGKVDSIGNG